MSGNGICADPQQPGNLIVGSSQGGTKYVALGWGKSLESRIIHFGATHQRGSTVETSPAHGHDPLAMALKVALRLHIAEALRLADGLGLVDVAVQLDAMLETVDPAGETLQGYAPAIWRLPYENASCQDGIGDGGARKSVKRDSYYGRDGP